MDKTLPIVVKPSRLGRGVGALVSAAIAVFMFDKSATVEPEALKWLVYFFVAILGVASLFFGRECIFGTSPRVIIDEDGVGGCFVGGDFVGLKRIAWDDIIGARVSVQSELDLEGKFRRPTIKLVLDVDNKDGKYYRANGRNSPKAGRDNEDDAFAFDITDSVALDPIRIHYSWEAEKTAAAINNLTKSTLAERRQMTKNPFATDE